MLNNGSTLIDVFTIKRAIIDSELHVWQNIYCMESTIGFDDANAAQNAETLSVAEGHIHFSNVALVAVVVWPRDSFNLISTQTQCFSLLKNVAGMRSQHEFPGVVDWPMVYKMAKVPVVGRAQNMMFRQALMKSQIKSIAGERWALVDDVNTQNIESRFFDSFAQAGTWNHVCVSRDEPDEMPTAPRRVQHFVHSGVSKLRSVEDAQNRKTLSAISFRTLFYESLPGFVNLQAYYQSLLVANAEDIPTDDVRALAFMVTSLVGQWKAIVKYWSQGQAPEIAPEWRPTAGLNPNSQTAYNAVTTGESALLEWIEVIEQTIANSGDYVPRVIYESWAPEVYRQMLFYAVVLRSERWTGVPIPHAMP